MCMCMTGSAVPQWHTSCTPGQHLDLQGLGYTESRAVRKHLLFIHYTYTYTHDIIYTYLYIYVVPHIQLYTWYNQYMYTLCYSTVCYSM